MSACDRVSARACEHVCVSVRVVAMRDDDRSSPLGDMRAGEVGEKTVGELSLSSLKLKLFLFRDSAPEKRQRPREKRGRRKEKD